jgi:hypothetical protein
MRHSIRLACLIVACLAGAPAHAQEDKAGTTNALASLEQAPQLTASCANTRFRRKRSQGTGARSRRIRKDRESLNTAIIQAAKTEKKLATDVLDLEERLVRHRPRGRYGARQPARAARPCSPKFSPRCSAWGSIRRPRSW